MLNSEEIKDEQCFSDENIGLLEGLMEKYLNKKHVIAVSSTYEANIVIQSILNDDIYTIVETDIIPNCKADIGILNFQKDSKFPAIDSGVLIVTNNDMLAGNIRRQVVNNKDYIISPILAYMAIQYLDNSISS